MKFSRAFSLLELLIVMAIIAVLAVMILPMLEKAKDRAKSVACMNNLRQVGVAVGLYVGDNNNTFPFIEPNPSDPVYDPAVEAKPLLEELKDYGVTDKTLKCPDDIAGANYFATRGSSYQWAPILDGENQVNPIVYGRGGAPRKARLAVMRICMDFEPVHFNRCNRLYADGHVKAQLSAP